LNELVAQGLFSDKSSAIRQAIDNLLHGAGRFENRITEGTVNGSNAEDEVSNSLEELFSPQNERGRMQ